MRHDLSAGVEEITGRQVIAFLSANHIDPDIAIESFMLDPAETDGTRPGSGRAAVARAAGAGAMTPEAGTAAQLVSALRPWIDRLFPDTGRGERLVRALDERFGDDARAMTDELCREVEAVAHEFSRPPGARVRR